MPRTPHPLPLSPARPAGNRRRFLRDSAGSASIEAVIVLPILFWALVATLVFFDGFRSRNQSQIAAQTVADLLSREANMFTSNYLEGMNEVFDFLADSRFPTRLRISSIIWNSQTQLNRIQWSYGTRGLASLPEDTFELLDAGQYHILQTRFGNNDDFGFTGSAAQAPRPDLAERIPPVLPGEALILVESMALWSPWFNVGLGNIRFDPIVVTRPRFTPWVHLDGAIPIFPEDNYEVAIAGYVPEIPEPEPDDPPPGSVVTIAEQNFQPGDSTAGWSQTSTSQVFGNAGGNWFLGPFGQSTWTNPLVRQINLGTHTLASARVEFDLLILDSWDGLDPRWSHPEGDSLQLLINGTPITHDIFDHALAGVFGNARFAQVNHNGSVYVVSKELIQSGTNFFGASWTDQIWRVTIDIQAPSQSFDLGFSARLSNNINNESFGIDNFRITGVIGTPPAGIFQPDSSMLGGSFLRSRFARYNGCPDWRHAANWKTVRNAQLSGPLTLRRQAGGTRDLNTCGAVNGARFAHASPHMVLNYVNDTANVNGNRLRIRTEDGNNGRTCDATLLIRDPNGQWWFNSEISDSNWNARLNMGHAGDGLYQIWVGRWNSGLCTDDLEVIFSRY